jgi:hypothetical protein
VRLPKAAHGIRNRPSQQGIEMFILRKNYANRSGPGAAGASVESRPVTTRIRSGDHRRICETLRRLGRKAQGWRPFKPADRIGPAPAPCMWCSDCPEELKRLVGCGCEPAESNTR